MSTGKRHGPDGLRVYRLALSFAEQVSALVAGARCSRSLAEQLERAAESVVLNIAEGAAHFTPGMKLNHYRIAHASAGECLGGLDLLRRRDRTLNTFPARRNAEVISVLLTALIHHQQTRKSPPQPPPPPLPLPLPQPQPLDPT
jgi:four helix bundle protein